MTEIKVIHTLSKNSIGHKAGIYIQSPEFGIEDRRGRYHRHIEKPISISANPNDVIALCLKETFDISKDVERIIYEGPRRKNIEIFKEDTTDSIREKIRNA